LRGGEANRDAVSIRTNLATDLPKITADHVQAQQLLMNLMLNGIQAMKDTSRVLTVKSRPNQGSQVLMPITDSGAGLPLQSVEQIFSAFFTASRRARDGVSDQPFNYRVPFRLFVGHVQRRSEAPRIIHPSDATEGAKVPASDM